MRKSRLLRKLRDWGDRPDPLLRERALVYWSPSMQRFEKLLSSMSGLSFEALRLSRAPPSRWLDILMISLFVIGQAFRAEGERTSHPITEGPLFHSKDKES